MDTEPAAVLLQLLASTAVLALHARLRLIPNSAVDSLSGLAWHIGGITALAMGREGALQHA
jgi:hypothetical protein